MNRSLLVALLLLGGAPATAERLKARSPSSSTEVSRLEGELDRQRRVLLQILSLQQQHLQLLTQLATGGTAPAAAPVELSAPAADAQPPPRAAPRATRPAEPAPEEEKRGSLAGTVTIKHGDPQTAWIFVEDVTGAASGATASMSQKEKSFAPSVLVVQKGTKVAFPNRDTLFHNVFSMTPGTSFDLGEIKQGDSREVVLRTPGLVTVFCNLHPQMVGYILVVPGPLFTKVGAGGAFHLDDLPPGKHRVGAWAPGTGVVEAEVVISERPATLELTLEKRPPGAHLRKDGSPYGSYRE